jgi:hypothetical protein
MKRHGLILPSLLILLLGGIVLIATGLLSHSSPPPVLPIETNNPPDSVDNEAIQRWRAGQPHHWRACLLQQ